MATKTIPWDLIEDLLRERGRERDWFEAKLHLKTNNISNWKTRGVPKNRAADIAGILGTTSDYLLQVPGAQKDLNKLTVSEGLDDSEERRHLHRRDIDQAIALKSDEVIIPQYDAGGSMGNGLVLEGTAGVIKSWRVDYEWLRLNVRAHTNVNNLCIVTGFGPSMRPMFNPGDPLLLDRGVTTFDHEDTVYFFRIGNHGYIKTVQRIPQVGGGLIYRAKSENPRFDSFDIVDGMDFEVFGKILTVWKSEQF